MFRSWKLGTAFGIGIFVHWSFLLLPLLAITSTGAWGHPLAALLIFSVIAAVFGCVVLHELGHALTARHFGIPTRDITLYPIGGVARLERMSEKPWEEFWIAVAGPAVNVVIIIALTAVLELTHWLAPWDYRSISIGEEFLIVLRKINWFLVLFNMVPAFPMDGGRVLRALLASRLGHLRATEVAANVGVFFAGLIIMAGFGLLRWTDIEVLEGSPMMVFIGIFVLFAGQQERLMVRYRARVRELQQRGLWPGWYGEVNYGPAATQAPIVVQDAGPAPPAAALDPFRMDPSVLPAEPNFSGFTWDAGRRAWIEWRNGQPVHICWVQ